MAGTPLISTAGINQFRREIKALDPAVAKELQVALRGVAKQVAGQASQNAPRGDTGDLAAGYRGTATGTKAVVRNTVFYSRFIEFGFHPGGYERFVEGDAPIGRAVDSDEDRIVDLLGEAIEAAAESLGWL